MSTDRMSWVPARVSYLRAWSGSAPVSHAQDETLNNFSLVESEVKMADARTLPVSPELAREGFTLVVSDTSLSPVPSDEEIAARYLPETERLLREVTGAARVFTFASGLRFNERSQYSGSRPNSRPARRVHSDFSSGGALEIAIRAFGEDGELPRTGYWRAFNVWRALSAPPQDTALGFCDLRSIAPSDIVTAKGVVALPSGREESFEFCLYQHNMEHRWAYYPNMTRDEAAIFVGYDSRDPNRRVAHCAFDDPTCPPDVDPRISVEVRAVAYFEE